MKLTNRIGRDIINKNYGSELDALIAQSLIPFSALKYLYILGFPEPVGLLSEPLITEVMSFQLITSLSGQDRS